MKLISLAAAVVLTLAACSREPDPTEAAEKALQEANLAGVTVKWDDDAWIAHLRGTVESTTDRDRAADLAESAIGTSGRVLNELTVKGLNEETADDLDGRIRSVAFAVQGIGLMLAPKSGAELRSDLRARLPIAHRSRSGSRRYDRVCCPESLIRTASSWVTLRSLRASGT